MPSTVRPGHDAREGLASPENPGTPAGARKGVSWSRRRGLPTGWRARPKAGTGPSIHEKRLGLDYLDLYLIHQPYGDYYGSWCAMRALSEQGLVKAAGVASFYPDRLVDLIDRTGFTPAVNQIETTPTSSGRPTTARAARW